jgi:hypothetical protein
MAQGLNDLPLSILGGVQVQTDDVANDLKVHDRVVDLSFESGEQASYKQYLTQAARVTALRVHVTKALAGTDAGTLDLYDAAGNLKGTMNLAAGLALNSEQTMTVTAFTVAAGSFYRLNTAKTTAGGKIKAIVTESRNGNG